MKSQILRQQMARLHRGAGFCMIVALLIGLVSPSAVADNSDVGTTFTYQGRLTESNEPVSGTVDLEFRLFSVEVGGSPLPGGVLVADDVEISDDGRFTIDLDFGDQFNGDPRWLEIEVNGETLAPRQPIMAAPHAMVATTAANVPVKAVVGTYAGITGVGTLESLNVNGNVGIGVANPQWPLEVSGRIQASGPESALFTRNPNNFLASAALDWQDDVPRLRLGGNGAGSQSGFDIQRAGDISIMRLLYNGRVGIGTVDPQRRFHVAGMGRFGVDNNYAEFDGSEGLATLRRNDTLGPRLQFFNTSGSNNSAYGTIDFEAFEGIRARIVYGDPNFSPAGLQFFGSSALHMKITDDGNIGVGTNDPASRFHVATGSDASPAGGGFLIIGETGDVNIALDSNEIMARSNGSASALLLNREGGDVIVGSASGGTSSLVTPVLQITGGSDLSERFDIGIIDDLEPQPGMVVCIDPAKPGKLIPSTRAYDRTVAGIISGAGGVKTGMLMGQEGSEADGEHAVALTGRVYVFVDATDDAVQPGDLLTTSDVPGHAMKVAEYDMARGAILGKAMTPLDKGEQGLVLVLVGLQ